VISASASLFSRTGVPPASPCCDASLALLAEPKLPHFGIKAIRNLLTANRPCASAVHSPEPPSSAVSPELGFLTHAALCPSARVSSSELPRSSTDPSVPKLERSDLLSAVCYAIHSIRRSLLLSQRLRLGSDHPPILHSVCPPFLISSHPLIVSRARSLPSPVRQGQFRFPIENVDNRCCGPPREGLT
jgi:hypothetical protein